MSEPISAGASSAFILTGAVGAFFGPVYGPVILMLFSALMGAMLALQGTKIEPSTHWESAKFVLLAIGLSMTLTGTGVWVLERFTPLPGSLAIMVVAFFFAAARNLILDAIKRLLDKLVDMVSIGGAK